MKAYPEPQSENDILIVDDTNPNLVLLHNILRDAGFKTRTASNADSVFKCIEEKLPTLILLDVKMPGMDGFEMCRILKAGKETCSIPVLLITAHEGENHTITGLKAGASDFIYKPFNEDEILARVKTHFEMRQIQLQLEVQKITLLNEINERKKAELEISEAKENAEASRNFYETVINKMGDLVFVKDEQSRLILVNEAFCKVFDLSRADILGKTLAEDVTPEEQESFLKIDKQVLSDGIENINEESLTVRDGQTRSISTRKSRFIDNNGDKFLIGVIRDFTERKKAEDEIISLSRIYAVISQVNQMVVREKNTEKLLQTICNIAIDFGKFKMAWIGFADEETNLVKPVAYAGFEDSYLSEIKRISIADIAEGRGPVGTAIREGKYFVSNDIENDAAMTPWKEDAIQRGYRSLIALPIWFFGKVLGAYTLYAKDSHFFNQKEIDLLLEVVGDIGHALEAAETEKMKQKAEADLKTSENKFRNLFENSSIGISMTGIDGTIHINKSFCDILGYSKEELKAINWKEISYAEDIERTNSILRDLQEGKIKQARFEKRYLHKTGSIIWADVSTFLQRDQNDKPLYFITSLNNITEQKHAEKQLRESEEYLRITLKSIGDGVITTDSEGKVRQMNPVAEQLTGWTEVEAKGRLLEEVFPIINEDTRATVEIPVRRVLREGIVVGLANHTLLIAKDGTELPIADSGAPIRNIANEIIGVVLVFRDQTEDRKAEFELRESEKRFKLLYENAPLSYQSLDTNARLIDVNKAWLATLGYKREEVIGNHFRDFMTPESAELIKARFPAFVAAGEIHDYQFEMVRKDGTHITVSYEGRIGHDELGHFKQTHCIFTDITERKRVETALGKLRLQMEKILSSAGEGIFGLDIHGMITFVNPAAAHMIGWTAEELPGKNHHEIAHHTKPDGTTHPENECKIHASFREGKTYKITNEIFWHKDGTSFPVEYTSTPMYDEQGIILGAVVTFGDITQRLKAIADLRDSEEAYRQISNAVSDYIFSESLDTNGKGIEYWTAGAFETITGYTLEEYKACGGWRARLHPDDIESDNRDLDKLRLNQRISSEVRIIKKDGSVHWVKVYANPVMNQDGTDLIGIKGAVQDINERKLAEEELLKLKNELEFTVAEKTKELNERVAELERFYDATIDRELRMKELRDEIELLKSGK